MAVGGGLKQAVEIILAFWMLNEHSLFQLLLKWQQFITEIKEKYI